MDGQLICLVGMNPEIESIVEDVLEDAGYAVDRHLLEPDAAKLLAEAHPALIVVQVGLRPEPLSLVDELRLDERTRAIPIIVLGTLEPTQALAQAAGNVYNVLPMPFDLNELLAGVRGALAGTSFEARVEAEPITPEPAFEASADLLVAEERALMLDWVQQIRQVEPFSSRPDLTTREFLDGLPRILNALVLVLRHPTAADVLTRDSDIRARLRSHVAIRRRQGVPTDGVAREYQVLRDVISARLRRHVGAGSLQEVMDQVNTLLDQAVRVTITEYQRLARSEADS